ncbi:serpin family protein [uncultured Brachybacterium sp.]|uniref:serpin family protein n=1 Tax=uncultured Brachybacterium sp. TaxID=189680 RepID=UPI002637DFCA|nr:serpin family protein [uncultured Brachybacterium sp.]
MTIDVPGLPPRSPLGRLSLGRRVVLAGAAALPLAAVGLTACGTEGDGGAEPDLSAELPRAEPGPAEGAGDMVAPFTARMLGAIDRSEVNAVCSPLSAQVALTMAGMGAAGSTRSQMEEVLGGSMEDLAEGANTLSQLLATVGEQEREQDDDEAPEPAVASLVNGTWLQEGFEVQQSFLEDLATWFGSGVFEADFTDDATREGARQGINDWVEESTDDLIEELLPEGILTADTRLVLVNALHLKAAWPEELTKSGGTFTTADGEELSAELLHGSTSTWYEDGTCRATSLDTYGEDLALALVQPIGGLAEVLDAWAEAASEQGSGLAALLSGLEDSHASTQLTVPAFDIGWDSSLKGTLESLGMTDAFSSAADFSGITGTAELVIDEVLQKAVITIDEQGMEAAAATAVIMAETSAQIPDHELVLDAPFLFLAYERSTLAPLVVGWIGDPTETR